MLMTFLFLNNKKYKNNANLSLTRALINAVGVKFFSTFKAKLPRVYNILYLFEMK